MSHTWPDSSHISRPQCHQPSQPNPTTSPSNPIATVDCLLSHLTFLINHNPLRVTVNGDSCTNIDDSKTTTLCDEPYHQCQCITLSQPRTASNPLSPKASSKPGTHLTVSQPVTGLPKEAHSRQPMPHALQATATPANWASPPWALPAPVPWPQVPPMMKQSPSIVVTPPSPPSSYIPGYPSPIMRQPSWSCNQDHKSGCSTMCPYLSPPMAVTMSHQKPPTLTTKMNSHQQPLSLTRKRQSHQQPRPPAQPLRKSHHQPLTLMMWSEVTNSPKTKNKEMTVKSKLKQVTLNANKDILI